MENHAMENALLELEREGFINLGDFIQEYSKKKLKLSENKEKDAIVKPKYISRANEEQEVTTLETNPKIINLEKEIDELKTKNKQLQSMLTKALEFARTVRDSRVGKLFFGKKAKEVLSEQDKNIKQLPEGR